MPKPLRGAYKLPDTSMDRIVFTQEKDRVRIEYQELINGKWCVSDLGALLPPGMDIYHKEDIEPASDTPESVEAKMQGVKTIIRHIQEVL